MNKFLSRFWPLLAAIVIAVGSFAPSLFSGATFNGDYSVNTLTANGVITANATHKLLYSYPPYLTDGTNYFFQGVQMLSLPTTSSWSWVNQGGASVVQTNNAIYLTAPANSGDSLRQRVLSLTGTPTITATIQPMLYNTVATGSLFGLCGIEMRESGTSKIATFGLQVDNNNGTQHSFVPHIEVVRWTDSSTFAAAALDQAAWNTSVVYLRMAYNGTNLLYSISPDHVNWTQIYSEAKGTPFTTAPNQLGIFVDQNNNTANQVSACNFVEFDVQ